MLMGRHLLAHWSSTLTVIALSSAEAELNAMVKMFSETIGLRNTLKDMGRMATVEIFTDSSASKGMVHRVGCGKVKHLETRQLWIQEYVNSKAVGVTKIPRLYNASDALTHHWSAVDGARHFEKVGIIWK